MKRLLAMLSVLLLTMVPFASSAAPKSGLTTKTFVSRYESELKLFGNVVYIADKKLVFETVKRDDKRKEFSTERAGNGKINGITFPSSDMIEDVVFSYQSKDQSALTFELLSFISSVSAKKDAADRMSEAQTLLSQLMFATSTTADGVMRVEKNGYIVSMWELNGALFYRFSHTKAELKNEWINQKGIYEPLEAVAAGEATLNSIISYPLSAGEYEVGDHIPAGEYKVVPDKSAEIAVYRNGDLITKENLDVDDTDEIGRLVLETGDIIKINGGKLKFVPLDEK